MNLKPINRALEVILGDIGELPMAATWTQLVWEEDQVIRISQADMSSAFYLFRLPPEWRRMFGFNSIFKGSEVGRPEFTEVVPSCLVLPMGWNSSVGLMQMASRELIRRIGSGHGEELRRGKLVPAWFVDVVEREGAHWWQVYLDNYMAGSIEKKDTASGKTAHMHAEAVDSWTERGVISADDKHVIESLDSLSWLQSPWFLLATSAQRWSGYR